MNKTKGMKALEYFDCIAENGTMICCEEDERQHKILEQELKEASELNKTPTADEVCEALSEYLGKEVVYNYFGKNMFIVDEGLKEYGEISRYYKDKNVVINYMFLPPHLLELIAKFYKGVESNE
jgi:ATP-dependent protease Clp ATPase subunit